MDFDGGKLDKQQIEAVVACEDAQLVLASAGSGKTFSLLAKIDYLVGKLCIDPARILVISFTRKTVAELRERCAQAAVEIKTFHGLGNELLRFGATSGLDSMRLISEEELYSFVRRFLMQYKSLRQLNDFLLFYSSAPYPPGDFNSHGERISFNKNYLHDSSVRSKEDRLLMNWFLIHGLRYEYMQPYDFEPKYRPLFKVNDIYVDISFTHEDGSSIYGDNYLRDLKWRREMHARNDTKYIELSSSEWADCELFVHLDEDLRLNGLSVRRLPEPEIFSMIQRDFSSEYDGFVRLLVTFLLLFKNNLHRLEDLRERAAKLPTLWERQRATVFLDIFCELLTAYEKHLATERAYDFADMINSAAQTVTEVKECANHYEYILLDEVQDLSKNRLVLIREILRKNPKCRLFAVGDDWQSIYRFAGSNLELISNFEHFFEKTTHRSLIETTHRFGGATVRVSGAFIQKNPAQARKKIRGNKTETPIEIVLVREEDLAPRNSDAPALNRALLSLTDKYGFEGLATKELQIISRFNRDILRLKADNIEIAGEKVLWRNPQNLEQSLEIDFCSMHKSKGITRDIVFVLNMNDDQMGMPARGETDPLIDMLLSDAEPYAFAEERRLFYVAITRAREATYLIANEKNPSPFLFEISEELCESIKNLCPRCQEGLLAGKKLPSGEIYYCSNFRYGCNYVKRKK